MTDFNTAIAARTLWMEARGEGPAGEQAVAHVIFNRLSSDRWGSCYASVCLAPFQFSCWNTADPNRRTMAALSEADSDIAACVALFSGIEDQDDPTFGATHYVTAAVLDQGAPAWVSGATRTVQIGNHVFFKDVK